MGAATRGGEIPERSGGGPRSQARAYLRYVSFCCAASSKKGIITVPVGPSPVPGVQTAQRFWTAAGPAVPVRVLGGEARGAPLVTRLVTLFALEAHFAAGRPARGTLLLGEGEPAFDAFGDASGAPGTRTGTAGPAATRLAVTFRPVRPRPPRSPDEPATDRGRQLYEIVLPGRSGAGASASDRLYLVLGAGTGLPDRLLVGPAGARPPRSDPFERSMNYVFPLHSSRAARDPLGDAPLGAHIALGGLYLFAAGAAGAGRVRMARISVSGTPGGAGHLTLDPNLLTLDDFGDVAMTTLMGFQPFPVTLKPLAVPDPSGRGRRLFEVVPEPGAAERGLRDRYFLVLAPGEAGPHRLIQWTGGRARQTVSLYDPRRQDYLALLPRLAGVSAQERRGVETIRRVVGYGTRYRIEGRRVVGLDLFGGENNDRAAAAALGDLRHLRSLEFHGPSRLTGAGLGRLAGLGELEELKLTDCVVAAGALAGVRGLTRLRSFFLYITEGVADQDLAALAPLRNLKLLWFYREDRAGGLPPSGEARARITDAGLQHLAGLTRLEQLNLMGHRITDAGLRHLAGLTRLTDLNLSGPGITDAGLEHLRRLGRLERLSLYQTRVTPAGRRALRRHLPLLEPE